MNNARALEAVEDEVALRRPRRSDRHRSASSFVARSNVRPTSSFVSDVRPTEEGGAELSMWLVAGGEVRMSADREDGIQCPGMTDAFP